MTCGGHLNIISILTWINPMREEENLMKKKSAVVGWWDSATEILWFFTRDQDVNFSDVVQCLNCRSPCKIASWKIFLTDSAIYQLHIKLSGVYKAHFTWFSTGSIDAINFFFPLSRKSRIYFRKKNQFKRQTLFTFWFNDCRGVRKY